METNELLLQICDKLRIPHADSGQEPPAEARVVEGERWRSLRLAIRNLEESAAQVGELPASYPMHLKPVMRLMYALLPWYTRPMRRHAENTVAAAHALRAVLEDLEARITPLEKPRGEASR